VDEEQEVITQISLLLTQVRYARRALENIELATTRYAGLALRVAGSPGGAPLGAPPLIDGALKVYVVNINDLTTGGPGIGDMLAGVLGGAGRFLGGFFGGIAGGTVSGVLFPYLFVQMRRIVESLERIANRIGYTGSRDEKTGEPKKDEAPGLSLMAQLEALAATLRLVADVFRAAAGQGTAAAPAGPEPEVMGSVRTFLDLVRALSRVVDGLILLVPLLLGALASFLVKLDDIKLAIVDMLQFGLRNVLLLRAAVLAIVLDTLSLAARLAAGVLGILATAVDTVLESIFRVIRAGLDTALVALRIASTGIKGTIDALMLFLRDGVGALLGYLGGLRLFRLVVHLAEVLPHILPAIARIMEAPLTPMEIGALGQAAALKPPSGPLGTVGTPAMPSFPDLAALLLPPTAQTELVGKVDALGRTIRDEARVSFGAVQGAVDGIGGRMRATIGTLDRGLDEELTSRLGRARGHAEDLAKSLQAAEDVSKRRPLTGLEAIAKAYEGWLQGGGLKTLMGQLDAHFRTSAATEAEGSIAGRVVTGVLGGAGTRSVVVEIGEVTIDLGEVTPAVEGAEAGGPSFDAEALVEWQRNQEERRGFVPTLGLVPA
jgi:hypothetical protein